MKQIILIGAALLIILIVVASANPTLVQTIQEHRRYLYVSVGVGISMYPHIQNGDLLIIMEKTDPSFSVNIGDILVYKYQDMMVAHRVFLIQNNQYHVKGDYNPTPDAIIVTNDILIGKVINIISRDNPIGKTVAEAML